MIQILGEEARASAAGDARRLQAKAHDLIPGGCHTYAKGDDQFPELAPRFIARGSGCRVWDVDGREFIDFGMGCRAVTLGHAEPRVTAAAARQMQLGAAFTRPAPIEVECAERFLEFVPAADMVKFTKDGSTATTAALRLARAFTGRDLIAFCGDHPFFSYDDWFIGATAVDAGIPQPHKDLALTFAYNDLASLERLFAAHPGRLAAVILEPAKNDPPRDGFLHQVQQLCRRHGTVFILDEMITGFRLHKGGGQALFDVRPDLSTFGKGLGNGFALSALCGKREIMELGGLRHDQPRVFLLSTTHGAETHALAAAVEVARVYRTEPVVEHLWRVGERLAAGCREAIAEAGVTGRVEILGFPPNLVFATRDGQGRPSQGYRALLMQELARRGVLAPSLTVSYAHQSADIDEAVEAFRQSLAVYARALEDGYEAHLVGAPTKPVYRRMN